MPVAKTIRATPPTELWPTALQQITKADDSFTYFLPMAFPFPLPSPSQPIYATPNRCYSWANYTELDPPGSHGCAAVGSLS